MKYFIIRDRTILVVLFVVFFLGFFSGWVGDKVTTNALEKGSEPTDLELTESASSDATNSTAFWDSNVHVDGSLEYVSYVSELTLTGEDREKLEREFKKTGAREAYKSETADIRISLVDFQGSRYVKIEGFDVTRYLRYDGGAFLTDDRLQYILCELASVYNKRRWDESKKTGYLRVSDKGVVSRHPATDQLPFVHVPPF